MKADEQCAEAIPRAFRIRKTADYELLNPTAFRFQPSQAAAGRVERIAPLGNHAFQPGLAHLLVKLAARAGDMLAVAKVKLAGALAQQFFGERLAILECGS